MSAFAAQGEGPRVVIVLASVLATRVSWYWRYRLTPASDLGATSPWAGRLSQVLRTRVAELRFARPYAVVAVARHQIPSTGTAAPGPWDGLPVFSAWITEPDDAS
ncbi:hypothetical protein FRACA_610004 [Frankia canadensis]|uniref:Uncharacterized protein n=1 Tax=Frankia canadensis TaxID=1836972 RepID=A0A2I2KZN2_9ACTN|nr:hypothetical protein [Frankia canadensis]SNQ51123.1 hypothetical protein FRACA_610004 [Frankia canadensis]SOU58413.1 hypothetical protein FRACA_610004 [Frankia canadensis]